MMTRVGEQQISQTKPKQWFRLAFAGILLVSLGLRFWGLGRFNTLVFDEVYYAKFANNYLTQTPFFDGHPPLSKYLIAFGIWLARGWPIGQDTVNAETGSILSTWSYRWLNALTGSFLPWLVAAIAFELSQRRSYALIAGLFAALDGLFLVESRYALNNVYLVLFGLLGQWCVLRALRTYQPTYELSATQPRQPWLWLAGAGLCFGASISIKWNGLWFLLGAYLLWGVAWLLRGIDLWINRRIDRGRTAPTPLSAESLLLPEDVNPLPDTSPSFPYRPIAALSHLSQIQLLPMIVGLGVVPAVFYWLIWQPHIQLNLGTPQFNFSFWDVQYQILAYHERVGSGMTIHPYCSTWYSWIFMQRPVAYFYQVGNHASKPILPAGEGAALGNSAVYDVHAIGNPLLWWFSTLAIALMILLVLDNRRSLPALMRPWLLSPTPLRRDLWIGLYLMVNYLANLAPWMRVSRCVFLYHYMGCSVFATLALAWLVDRWLSSPRFRTAGWLVIGLVVVAFWFWLPIYLGLPLSTQDYGQRMLLRSWI